MTGSLQHYTITITAGGPLFVGSGQSIGKKEYLFDPDRQQVSIPDLSRLSLFLQERRLTEAYSCYMLNEREDFSRWLQAQGVPPQQWAPWIAYTIDSGDAVFEKIAAFIKDPYGCPYVPGSSLKGALRTALLAADILERPQYYRQNRQELLSAPVTGRWGDWKRETARLEQRAFYTLNCDREKPWSGVNDILRGLRVGDSAPLSVEDLTLCQKIGLLPDGQQRRISTLWECLKPGTVLRFPLTIDPGLCPVTPERLLQAAMRIAEAYDRSCLKHFPMQEIRGGGNLYLGGGCGFFSKTVLYPLLGADGLRRTSQLLDRQFRNHRHGQDRSLGVSPPTVKCTLYQGELYEMGACTMEIR